MNWNSLAKSKMTQTASVKNCRLIGTTDIRVPEPARRRFLVRALELTLLLTVICLVATGPASAAPYVYVISVDQQFGIVDLATGHFSAIGNGTPDGLADLVWWKDGTLLTLIVTGPNTGSLAKLDPTTGEETLIGPTGLGFNIFSLGKARGNLYATDFSNNLYSVDPMTGAATLIGATGVPPDPNIPFTFNTDGSFNFCDQGFYNVDGQLYATFDSLAPESQRSLHKPAKGSPLSFRRMERSMPSRAYLTDSTSRSTSPLSITSFSR